MITENQASYLNRLIKRVVEAEIAYFDKGSLPLSERNAVNEEHYAAATRLSRYIEKLQRE